MAMVQQQQQQLGIPNSITMSNHEKIISFDSSSMLSSGINKSSPSNSTYSTIPMSPKTSASIYSTEQGNSMIRPRFDSEDNDDDDDDDDDTFADQEQQSVGGDEESSFADFPSSYSFGGENSVSCADYGYDQEDEDLKMRREIFLLTHQHDDHTEEEEDLLDLSDCGSYTDEYFGYCSSSCSEDDGYNDDSSTLSDEVELTITETMKEMELERKMVAKSAAAAAAATPSTFTTQRDDCSSSRIQFDEAPSSPIRRHTVSGIDSPCHPPVSAGAPKSPKKKQLSFDSVELREYSVTVGAYAAVQDSCPLSLDWKHTAERRSSLVEYERVKEERDREREYRERRSSCVATCDNSRGSPKATADAPLDFRPSPIRSPRRLSIEERRSRIASVRRLSMEQVQRLERETLISQIQDILESTKLLTSP